jgi:hypothetical protein
MKKYTIGIVLIVLLLTACIPQISADPAENESDLRITGMVTSLGGEPDNFEQGIFNYTVTITNNSGQQKTITGVEPMFCNLFLHCTLINIESKSNISRSKTKMKNRSFIIITLIGILIFSMACTITLPDNFSLRQVRGSGNVVEETRTVSGFDTVVLKGIGNIYIEQGSSEGLRIEAEDNLIEHMEIEVVGDRLEIDFDNVINLRPTEPINFYVTMIDVESIQLLGSGNINARPITTLKKSVLFWQGPEISRLKI